MLEPDVAIDSATRVDYPQYSGSHDSTSLPISVYSPYSITSMVEGKMFGVPRPGTSPEILLELYLEEMPEGDPDLYMENVVMGLVETVGRATEIDPVGRPSRQEHSDDITAKFRLGASSMDNERFVVTEGLLTETRESIDNATDIDIKRVRLLVE